MGRRLATAAAIEDLKIIAKRRIPTVALTYLDEGAGEGAGVDRNIASFDRILFRPRRLGSKPASSEVMVFGRRYSAPFGAAPVGLANLAWPGADLAIAGFAERNKFPYVLSGAATTSMEDIVKAAPGATWFQLYPARDEAITDDFIRRAQTAGIQVLVLTADVPASSRRNRSIREEVAVPFRMTPRILLDLITHPQWSLATIRAGLPQLANYAPYLKDANVQYAGRMMAQLNKHGLQWSDLESIRDRWKGRLVVKGILDPRDAVKAVELGADGIWVSNHGGRQLESFPAAIDALPEIKGAVPASTPVFLDGGVRTGEGVAKAIALGADLVFLGRAFIYGAGAGGSMGVERSFEILSAELQNCLTQTGCASLSDLRDRVLA